MPSMPLPPRTDAEKSVPKKPVRPNAYSEGEDEAPKLIEEEPVDIERDIPDTENQSIESEERQGEAEPPLFEE